MPRYLRIFLGLGIAALVIGGPLYYRSCQAARFRNFHVVREGVLYRSGQLNLSGLKRVIHDHGIKTVVSLRDAHVQGNPPPDVAEEQYCKEAGYNYFRIPARTWWASDGTVPAEIGLEEFHNIMKNPANHPVLVHCLAGMHRTGAYCAVFRMDFDRWSNSQALAEMRTHGYRMIEDEWDILGFMENYQPKESLRPASPPIATPPEKVTIRPASFVPASRQPSLIPLAKDPENKVNLEDEKPGEWTRWGILRRVLDKEATYVLENLQGQPIVQVRASKDQQNLEPYEGRKLSVYGRIYHSQDSPNLPCIRATHVAVE